MRTLAVTALSLICLVAPVMGQGDFEKGISYYKQGQYAKAIQEFEQIVKTNPEYESGHRILGDSYLRLKDYKKAIEAFQKSVRLKDDNYVSHYGLALAYYNDGQYRNAVATLLKAERHAGSPRDRYQLYQTRGSAYYNIREFNRAIADLQKATSIRRGNLEDILHLGISFYQVGDLAQAEEYLKRALALDPQSAEAQRYLSRLAYQRAIRAIEGQDYREAAGLLANYVKENPQDADAWFNLGLAHLFIPNLEMAENSFLKTAQLDPANWEVYDRLGYVYEKKNDYSKALQNYQKANNIHPDPQLEESVKRIQERIRRRRETP